MCDISDLHDMCDLNTCRLMSNTCDMCDLIQSSFLDLGHVVGVIHGICVICVIQEGKLFYLLFFF